MLKCFAMTTMCLLAGGVTLGASGAYAQTKTTTFDVRITIEAECVLSSATAMDFGTAGVLDHDIDAESAVTVQCTDGVPYEVALNGGLDGDRGMIGPEDNYIDYELYQDAARSLEWGDKSKVDTVAGTGTGDKQELKVYGRVSPQWVGAVGVYTDTVTVSVIY